MSFQLDGGILKYFEECGGSHYDGECFVFDQRVGVDPALPRDGDGAMLRLPDAADGGGPGERPLCCGQVVSLLLCDLGARKMGGGDPGTAGNPSPRDDAAAGIGPIR